MKLIGAGLPRTATTTQMIALEQLGLPCYHMRNLMTNMEEHLPLWYDAYEGRPDWEKIFEGCESTVDWPAAFHYKALMEYYPDAKVLLSVRDHEKWERSMRDTILEIYFGRGVLHHLAQARYQVDPVFRRWYDLNVRMCFTTGAPFAGAYAERERMVEAAAAWDEEVKRTVPADRLIVWEPKDGWEPICEALDLPVPAEPIPNVNDTAGFKMGIMAGALGAIQGWFGETYGDQGAHGFNDASARHQ